MKLRRLRSTLQKRRLSLSISRADLARKSGVSKETLRTLEAGLGDVRLQTLEAASALGLVLTGLAPAASWGERMRIERVSRNLTARETTSLTAVSHPTILRMEKGLCSVSTFLRAAAAFDINLKLIERGDKYDELGRRLTDEMYTEPNFIGKIQSCVELDLDVCAPSNRSTAVCAKASITREQNSLIVSWSARTVWMNPPFSLVSSFAQKAAEELRCGNIQNLIFLHLSTSASAKWYQDLIGSQRHFILPIIKRLQFSPGGGPYREVRYGMNLTIIHGDDASFAQNFGRAVSALAADGYVSPNTENLWNAHIGMT